MTEDSPIGRCYQEWLSEHAPTHNLRTVGKVSACCLVAYAVLYPQVPSASLQISIAIGFLGFIGYVWCASAPPVLYTSVLSSEAALEWTDQMEIVVKACFPDQDFDKGREDGETILECICGFYDLQVPARCA